MSEKKKGLWRPLQDAWIEGWSKVANRVVESDTINTVAGRSVNIYLRTLEPFQHMFEKTIERTLHQMQLPTRNEISTLASRMTHIEKKLDDIVSLLEDIKQRQDA